MLFQFNKMILELFYKLVITMCAAILFFENKARKRKAIGLCWKIVLPADGSFTFPRDYRAKN